MNLDHLACQLNWVDNVESDIVVLENLFADEDAENSTIELVKRGVVVVTFDVLDFQFAENGVVLFGFAFLFDVIKFTAE